MHQGICFSSMAPGNNPATPGSKPRFENWREADLTGDDFDLGQYQSGPDGLTCLGLPVVFHNS
jgi:hypothetical protein